MIIATWIGIGIITLLSIYGVYKTNEVDEKMMKNRMRTRRYVSF